MNSPDASTRVVMSGAETTVGSMPTRCAAMGMSAPTVFAHVHTTSTVTPTHAASSQSTPHSLARPNAIAPSRRPSREAGHDLLGEHAEHVAQAHLAERERADDRRDRLRARVAAGADQERDEERERDDLRELVLEVAQHGAGRRLGDEEQHEPRDAAPHDAVDRRLEIRRGAGDVARHGGLVQRAGADARERRVEQIVDAHGADELARLVDDGQAQEVGCACSDLGRGAAIRLLVDRHRRLRH